MFSSFSPLLGVFGAGLSPSGPSSMLSSHLRPANLVLGSTFSPYLTGMDYDQYANDPNYMYDPSYQRVAADALAVGAMDAPGAIFKNFLKAQMMLVGTTRLSALAMGKPNVGPLTPFGLRTALFGSQIAKTAFGRAVQKVTHLGLGAVVGTMVTGNPILGAGLGGAISKFGIRGEFGDSLIGAKRFPGIMGTVGQGEIGNTIRHGLGPGISPIQHVTETYGRKISSQVIDNKNIQTEQIINRTTTKALSGKRNLANVERATREARGLTDYVDKQFKKNRGNFSDYDMQNVLNLSQTGMKSTYEADPIGRAVRATALSAGMGGMFVRDLVGGSLSRNLLSLGLGIVGGPMGAALGGFGRMAWNLSGTGYIGNLSKQIAKVNKEAVDAAENLEFATKKTKVSERKRNSSRGRTERGSAEKLRHEITDPPSVTTKLKMGDVPRLSASSILARGATVGLMTSIRTMYIIGGMKKAMSYTVDTGLNTIRNVVSLSRNIGRMEFGTGRTLDTAQASTERGRAIQAMQNVGISARSYLGQEARLVNAI